MNMGKLTKWMKNNIVWLMFGGVVILFLLNFSMVFFVDDKDLRGTFGDQFGAVNALFSGLAFTGLIYTIILQRRDLELQRHDLKLQRDELALTRQEMEEQTAEFEKQNETLNIQRFDNTFFNMLNLQQEITRDLVIEHKDTGTEMTVKKGRDVFPFFYEELKDRYAYSGGSEMTTFKRVLERDENYKKHLVGVRQMWFLDHYIRHLYRIFKYIDEAETVSATKKQDYATIVRATLSPYELVMLYYIGFSHPNLKKLIEKYALLNNLRPRLIADPQEGQSVARKFQKDYSFEMDKDMGLTSIETENVHDFRLIVNGEAMDLESTINFYKGDEITVRITRDDLFKESNLTLIGYDPYVAFDSRNIAESALDEPNDEEHILINYEEGK